MFKNFSKTVFFAYLLLLVVLTIASIATALSGNLIAGLLGLVSMLMTIWSFRLHLTLSDTEQSVVDLKSMTQFLRGQLKETSQKITSALEENRALRNRVNVLETEKLAAQAPKTTKAAPAEKEEKPVVKEDGVAAAAAKLKAKTQKLQDKKPRKKQK